MRRRLPIFLLVMTALVSLVYCYVGFRMTDVLALRVLIGVPFVAIWLIPVVYWSRSREGRTVFDQILQGFAFLSMGWVSFALVLSVVRDLAQAAAMLSGTDVVVHWLAAHGGAVVFGVSILGVIVGGLKAAHGPKLVEVEIPIPDLPPALDGFRIVQISDLHISSMIRRPYVERVKKLANEAKADMVALTGDIIDGPIHHLGDYAEPLRELQPAGRLFFITGNHEYYAGAPAWIAHFKGMGMTVLQNSYVTIEHKGVEVMIAGVVDPAIRMIDPKGGADPARAAQHVEQGPAAKNPVFRILLAHNPKLTSAAGKVGYDLQLSGHTHAGQFHPWTFVAKLVHAPHFAGLSREGNMWVYVSAGTGTWGPPVRLGTVPELTLLKLVRR